MKMEINRIDEPYVFEFSDLNGNTIIMDSSADLEGQNKGMTPMQVLLGSLMGCMSIDIILVLKKQKISPKNYRVEAITKKREGVPSPYEKIHFVVSIDADVDRKKINRAISLSLEKYCSVRACLKDDIEISFEVNPN
jgi:putative redox protein